MFVMHRGYLSAVFDIQCISHFLWQYTTSWFILSWKIVEQDTEDIYLLFLDEEMCLKLIILGRVAFDSEKFHFQLILK